MSTGSAVLVPHAGTLRGRLVHWDGLPSGVGKSLWHIVRRDGLDTARRIFTEENFYWNQIQRQWPADGYPAWTLGGSDDSGARNIAGNGEALSVPSATDTAGDPVEGSHEGWVNPEIAYELDFTYVLADECLVIIRGNNGTQCMGWDFPELDWEEMDSR